MQEQKVTGKPKERLRERREAREWGGEGQRERERKLERERMRVEEWKGTWGREGRKKVRKKKWKEGRKVIICGLSYIMIPLLMLPRKVKLPLKNNF